MCDCCEFTDSGYPFTPIDTSDELGIEYEKHDGFVYLAAWNGWDNELLTRVNYCCVCGREFTK